LCGDSDSENHGLQRVTWQFIDEEKLKEVEEMEKSRKRAKRRLGKVPLVGYKLVWKFGLAVFRCVLKFSHDPLAFCSTWGCVFGASG
jgi:hypothetical protein